MKTKTKVVAILLALVVLAGVGSAALLTYYGKLVGTSDLQQSVVISGTDWTTPVEYDIGSVAGNTYVNGPFPLENRANITAYVSFTTQQQADYGSGFVGAGDAVDTFYGGLLTLENKAADWSILSDDISATLKYSLQGDEFGYELEGTVLLENTDYALIYYTDSQDRFTNWGGENGTVITTVSSDGSGNIAASGKVDLGTDLPIVIDWNAGPEADYGVAPDNYNMRTGAKLWLVPTSALTGGNALPMISWNPSNYLFETDLIAYHDTDDGCGLRLGANSEMDMYIKNVFDLLAKPGAYRITTTVVPETECPLAP